MKEQDLRDNFNIEIVNYTTGLNNYSHTLDQCVQISKDYAKGESIGFAEWMHENAGYAGNGHYAVIGHNDYHTIPKLYEIYLTTKTK
jgi:hypothetical protein